MSFWFEVGPGGGEVARPGTEKRCSHKLQSGPVKTWTAVFVIINISGHQGVMNLGLGTSAGIGERKAELSGHRDVTNKSVRKIQRKVDRWLPRKCLQSSFSKRTDQNNERTKGKKYS